VVLSVNALTMASDEFKTKGNAAFADKNYDEAIGFFTEGIDVDPSNHVLYSNRSACYAGQQVYSICTRAIQRLPCQQACVHQTVEGIGRGTVMLARTACCVRLPVCGASLALTSRVTG